MTQNCCVDGQVNAYLRGIVCVCSIHANTAGAHSMCTVNIPALGLPRRLCTCRSGEDDATELSLLFINISTLQGLNCLHVAPDLPQSDASGLQPPASRTLGALTWLHPTRS